MKIENNNDNNGVRTAVGHSEKEHEADQKVEVRYSQKTKILVILKHCHQQMKMLIKILVKMS